VEDFDTKHRALEALERTELLTCATDRRPLLVGRRFGGGLPGSSYGRGAPLSPIRILRRDARSGREPERTGQAMMRTATGAVKA
jgi:hypothetical protein